MQGIAGTVTTGCLDTATPARSGIILREFPGFQESQPLDFINAVDAAESSKSPHPD